MNSQNSTQNVHKKEFESKKKDHKNISKKPDNTMEIDEHILRRFDIKKRLGKGAYGIVWKATDRKSKDVVAIKKIFDAFRNQTDAQRTFREIIFLQSFRNHPNIVKLHSIHRASNNKDIYLGFEYMETDLHNVIKRGNILKDVHKRYIMYQMLKATKYIHSGNVIHRDQKPSNVLIDSACRVKLADFGLARSVSSMYWSGDDADACLTDYVATRWYRAPEILVASKNYTKGIDMWSLGCILGEMLIGKPLFPGSSTVNQMERIMGALPSPSQEDISAVCTGYGSALIEGEGAAAARGVGVSLSRLLSACPRDAAQLTTQLLVFNPNKRLSADEALRHEYVARFHREKEEMTLREDIVLPLRDDQQLSVDDYRNKLYGLMARGGLKTSFSKSHVSSSSSGERNIPSNEELTKTTSAITKTTEHRQNKIISAEQKTRFGKPHKISDKNIAMSASHSIHVNTVHSESKINHAETRNMKVDNTKSENALAEKNKYNKKFSNMIRPLTSDPNFSLTPQNNLKHRQIDSWMTANEKSQANGDFAHISRQILTDCSVLSSGMKKNVTPGKGKRNSTSYGNITGVDGDNWPSWYKPGFAFNQKHGVITASALSDLRSSIR